MLKNFLNKLVIVGNDEVSWFLRKFIIKDNSSQTTYQEMYEMYKQYVDKKPLSKSTFTQKVRKNFIRQNGWIKQTKGVRGQIVFIGVGIGRED